MIPRPKIVLCCRSPPVNSAKAAESYRAYLAIRGKSTEDPLAADARKRAGE